MDTKDIDRTELERRLMWLLVAVWRQMSDSNCIEASFILHGALKELGIRSEVQPVAAWTVDNTNGMNAFLGRAGYEYFRKKAAENGHLMPDYVPVPGAPAFFVDGGHVIVLVPELELLMDATLDQVPGFALQRVMGPADDLSHDEPAVLGTEEANVGYLLVDDVIDLDPAHRQLIMDSGAALARRGLELGFSRAAFDVDAALFTRAAMPGGDPVMVCAVCGRPLNRYSGTFGEAWAHALEVDDDHPAVPVSSEDIRPVCRCDFCMELGADWVLPVEDFTIDTGVEGVPGQKSLGGWQCCTDCAALLGSGDWNGLAHRALASAHARGVRDPKLEVFAAVFHQVREHATGGVQRDRG